MYMDFQLRLPFDAVSAEHNWEVNQWVDYEEPRRPKYEDPTVELDFEPEEIYCEVCDCHYDEDDPCPFH